MWRSARPRPLRGVAHAAAPCPAPRSPTAAAASRSGQIGKKTAHHWSGASAMSVLEGRREPGHRGRHPLAAGPLGRDVDRDDLAAEVPGRAASADRQGIGRDAGLDGQHRRPHRHRGGRPEERDRGPATGQVAVADEPDRDAVTERLGELATGLAQADQADPGHAARPLEIGLQARVVDRLHRRHGLADLEGEEDGGQLHRPEMEPDEEDRLARDDGLGDELRGLELETLVDVGRP